MIKIFIFITRGNENLINKGTPSERVIRAGIRLKSITITNENKEIF
jgi:hypothetical protein